jgi:hypothetical protein
MHTDTKMCVIFVRSLSACENKRILSFLCNFLHIQLTILLKHTPLYISKYNVSATGLWLRRQVKPTQLGPIDKASPYLRRQNPVSETLYFEI